MTNLPPAAARLAVAACPSHTPGLTTPATTSSHRSSTRPPSSTRRLLSQVVMVAACCSFWWRRHSSVCWAGRTKVSLVIFSSPATARQVKTCGWWEQPGSRTDVTSLISTLLSPSCSPPERTTPSLNHRRSGLRPLAAAEQVRGEEGEEREAGRVVITRLEEGEGGRTRARAALMERRSRRRTGNIFRLERARPTTEVL